MQCPFVESIEPITDVKSCPFAVVCETAAARNGNPLGRIIKAQTSQTIVYPKEVLSGRSFVVLTGAYSLMVNKGNGNEEHLAVFGKGDMICFSGGDPASIIDQAHYLRTLIPGILCIISNESIKKYEGELSCGGQVSFSANALKRQMNSVLLYKYIVCIRDMHDRLLLMLYFLSHLVRDRMEFSPKIEITHSSLSTLIQAERASVTKMLHRIENEGYIEIIYKGIIFKNLDVLPEFSLVHYLLEELFC